MKSSLKTLIASAIGALAATVVTHAAAQDYPSKPIRIVVGFSAGGSNDIIARIIAPKLGELLGQNVVVENKPGAGGVIALSSVLASPADGHVVSMCTTGALSIQQHLGTPLPFNPEADIAPVTQIANAPYVLMVHSSVPAKNIKEFLAYAKANPGKLNYASSGNATGGHLAGEMFKSLAGVNLTHVPYKGTGQAITDLLSGQVQAIFDQPVSSMQYAKSGQLRPLGVGQLTRLPGFPDIPTIHESGVPKFDPVTWTGICAPKNTPPANMAKLQQGIAKVLAMPEIRNRLLQDGLDPVGSTPEQFKAFLAADRVKWGRIIKDANIKSE